MTEYEARQILEENDARLVYNKTHKCYYIDRVKPQFIGSSFYYTKLGLKNLDKEELLSKIPVARLL